MNHKTISQIFIGLSAVIGIFFTGYTTAAPILNTSNGHYYELIDASGSWFDYNQWANASSHNSWNGHLESPIGDL